jgi:hypothetical protein
MPDASAPRVRPAAHLAHLFQSPLAAITVGRSARTAVWLVETVAGRGPASASSVHLKGGKNAEPALVDIGLTLSASGELSGLGNTDVLVTLNATADPVATCTNQGNNQAPGQNPAPIQVTGSVAIPQDEIKNGNTPFAVLTNPPVTLIPGGAGLPEPELDRGHHRHAVHLRGRRRRAAPGHRGTHRSRTISSPSTNGPIPARDVSCTSS